MSWYLAVLKKYAVFSGRACRKEYWMFQLFQLIISVVLLLSLFTCIGMGVTFGALSDELDLDDVYLDIGLAVALMAMLSGTLPNLYFLATLIPTLAVTVRRLHDIGKSGWWIFIGLIPLIGMIWLLVLLATDSQPGENQYGPNPKEVSAGYQQGFSKF